MEGDCYYLFIIANYAVSYYLRLYDTILHMDYYIVSYYNII